MGRRSFPVEANKRAGGHNLLPPSTVSDMLRSQRLPRLELLSAFVHACGLGDAQAAAWERSWAELREQDLVLASSLDKEAAPPRPAASDWVTSRSREAPYGPRSWAVLVDLACGATGALAGTWLRFGTDVTWQYIVLSLALAGLWVTGLGLSGGYDVRFIGAGSDEFRKVFRTGLTLPHGGDGALLLGGPGRCLPRVPVHRRFRHDGARPGRQANCGASACTGSARWAGGCLAWWLLVTSLM